MTTNDFITEFSRHIFYRYKENINSYTREQIFDEKYNTYNIFNEYIPLYTLQAFSQDLGLFYNNKKEVIIEYSPTIKNCSPNFNYTRSYANFIKSTNQNFLKCMTLSKDNEFNKVFSIKGCIFDEEGILYCVVAKREVMEKQVICKDFILGKDDIKILISNRMFKPIYKRLYNSLDKNLLYKVRELDIDVILVNSIESKAYKPVPGNFIISEFKDIKDLKILLENRLQRLI